MQIPQLIPLDLRALHGAEIAYVFGSPPPPTEDDRVLGDSIQGYWTRFARSGSPNHHGLFRWPRYTDRTDRRLDLDVQPSVLTAFRRPECEFWWSVYDAEFIGSPSGAFLE